MKSGLTEATRIYVRYDTKDEKGLTRREKYPELSPELEIPLEGMYLWDWFTDISQSVTRIHDGVCSYIPPSEFLAWSTMSGTILRHAEYDILRSMDRAYTAAKNIELQEYFERIKPKGKNGNA